MKGPWYRPGAHRYIYNSSGGNKERAFTLTNIDGWEKKRYEPDPKDVFGVKQDCIIYTNPEKTFRFVLTVDRDSISVDFYLDETSEHIHSGGLFVERCLKDLPLATRLTNAVMAFNTSSLPISTVKTLPEISSVEEQQFFCIKEEDEERIYFADTDHGVYQQVETEDVSLDSRSETSKSVEAASETDASEDVSLDSRSETSKSAEEEFEADGSVSRQEEFRCRENCQIFVEDPDILNPWDPGNVTEIKFAIPNRNKRFTSLIEAIRIFQQECNLSEAVITDIINYIETKKLLFHSFRQDLPHLIEEDQALLCSKIQAVIPQDTGYTMELMEWFKANKLPGVVAFLGLCFPRENEQFAWAHREAQAALIQYSEPDSRVQAKNLLIVSLKIARHTKKQEDVVIAEKLLTAYSGGDEFQNVFGELTEEDSEDSEDSEDRTIRILVEQAATIFILRAALDRLKLGQSTTGDVASAAIDMTQAALQFKKPFAGDAPPAHALRSRARRMSHP